MSNENNSTGQNLDPEGSEKAQDNKSADGGFSELVSKEVPAGSDRRAFMMRSALAGVIATVTGCTPTAPTADTPAAKDPAVAESAPPLSPDLDVVKKGKGPVMTTIDEFYKVGP